MGVTKYAKYSLQHDCHLISAAETGLTCDAIADHFRVVHDHLRGAPQIHTPRELQIESLAMGDNVFLQNGTTAALVYIDKNQLIGANLGDSRATIVIREPANLFIRRDTPVLKNIFTYNANQKRVRSIPLTFDHTIENPKEKERALKAGGEIIDTKEGPRFRHVYALEEGFGVELSIVTGGFGNHILDSNWFRREPEIVMPNMQDLHLKDQEVFLILETDGGHLERTLEHRQRDYAKALIALGDQATPASIAAFLGEESKNVTPDNIKIIVTKLDFSNLNPLVLGVFDGNGPRLDKARLMEADQDGDLIDVNEGYGYKVSNVVRNLFRARFEPKAVVASSLDRNTKTGLDYAL